MGKRKIPKEKLVRLRKSYHSLREGGYGTGTFMRVQARELGVSKGTLWCALNKKTYKDVGGGPA